MADEWRRFAEPLESQIKTPAEAASFAMAAIAKVRGEMRAERDALLCILAQSGALDPWKAIEEIERRIEIGGLPAGLRKSLSADRQALLESIRERPRRSHTPPEDE